MISRYLRSARSLTLAVLMLVLVGTASSCATVTTRITDLRQFTLEDVEMAAHLAATAGDQAGIACYPVLAQRLRARLERPPAIAKGAVSAFELVRLAVRQAPDDTLRVACSALALEAAEDSLRIAGQAAAAAATFGAAGAPNALESLAKVRGLLKALGLPLP